MSTNLLYGSDNYAPNTPFFFDKIYENFATAYASANSDGVMIGRYILIAYSSEAYSRDKRVALEVIGNSESGTGREEAINNLATEDEKKYVRNYIIDKDFRNRSIPERNYTDSRDRRAYRKAYIDGQYKYTPLAYLHSDLSNEEIAILGMDVSDKILSRDENRNLKSQLDLVYKNDQLVLEGINDVQINTNDISTSQIVRDHILSTDKVLFYKDNKLQTNLSFKPITDKIQLVTTNGTNTTVTELPISIIYDSSDKYIKIKSGTTVISKFDATVFVKDSFLKSVEYKSGNTLSFTFQTENGEKQVVDTTLDIMDPGNGITIVGNVISAKASGDYLTVDTTGIHTTEALDEAINTAKEEAIAAAENKVKLVTSESDKGTGVNVGDICIVKTPIDNNNHFSYTAYIWQKSIGATPAHWEAMDGNYNAENIYFNDNIMVTKEIGYVTLTNGNGYIQSKGKNLVQVFDSMFTQEQDPSKTEPSVNITLNKADSYEVGETVTGITCTVSFNDGAYSYGPEPTGAQVNSWEIKDSNNKTYSYSASAISIPNVLVTDGINYTITAKANHSIGDIPKTNKGNNCTDTTKRIAAGTKSKTSAAITGYRYAFAGGTNASALNSSVIRGMSAKKSSKDDMNTEGNALEFSATKGSTKVFFAYPASWTGTPYFEMFGLAWAENVNFVKKSNVQVADARGGNNGLIYYNLYVWELDTPLAADSTRFRVWFK